MFDRNCENWYGQNKDAFPLTNFSITLLEEVVTQILTKSENLPVKIHRQS